MAKNLKINIKNSQLAEALKIDKQKKKPSASKAKAPAAQEVEAMLTPETPPPIKEEKIPERKIEEAAPVIEASPVKEEKPKEESIAAKDQPASSPKPKESSPSMEAPRPAFRPSSSQDTDRGTFQRSYERPKSGFERRYDTRPGGDRAPGFRPHPRPYPSQQGPSGYSGAPRPPYPPRPFTPRPPREPGIAPVIPPKEFSKGDKEAIKTTPAKKAFKNTVFEEEEFNKKSQVAYKENKDTFLKKSKEQSKSFDSRDRQGLRISDSGEEWRKKRTIKTKVVIQEDVTVRPKKLSVRLPITVKDLAAAMKLKASQLISKLFMQGVMITLNDFLDDETTVQLLGHEFDCEITIDTSEEDKIKITGKTIKEEIAESDSALLKIRPPVIAFMGHVDHGKTSLIDAIRSSNLAAGEAGAITQHIGAFQCHTPVGTITILDTPGHEAFSEMRSRGADVTDIVVLVVAGDEGIKTQTLEALRQAEEAGVTIVVAINKCDKPGFNAENVYRQLADNNHLPETWGGTTITVNCSALTKKGVPELLEMLALQAEVLELKANPETRARGTVIESEMHKGLGAVATVLVQNGTLRLGDSLVVGEHFARIKTLYDEHGKQLTEAGPSTPVKVTGLSGLPLAGNEFIVVKNEKEAKELSEKRTEGQRLIQLQAKRASLENFLQKKAEGVERKILPLILKADVQGSLEALKNSLLKIPSTKVELNIIQASVGEISESDIELAAASKASIIGFHTAIESHAESIIRENKVTVVIHDIIYHIVDEVKKLMLAQLDKIAEEKDTGCAEVKMVFKSSQLGNIAGCMVTDGIIKRNQHIRVVRNGSVLWKGPIASLKRVKEDVRDVSKGLECGIVLQGFKEYMPGDLLQSYDIIYLEQEL